MSLTGNNEILWLSIYAYQFVLFRQDQANASIIGLIVAQFKFSDQLLASESYNNMYEQLFDILSNTQNDGCREVIISNFRDFDECKQNDAVIRLLTMYEDRLDLLTSVIETVTEMCISDEAKVKISSVVQHMLESGCDSKFYPGIVKYQLYYSKHVDDVIANLRDHLKWDTASNDIKKKVMNLLEKSVRRQESKIADLWIKVVMNLEKSEDLKLTDFIMLLTIVNVKEEKLPAVKKIVSFSNFPYKSH